MKKKIIIGILFWSAGYIWNKFLFPYGGVFADWIWNTYSVGDSLYMLGYSLILSVVWK